MRGVPLAIEDGRAPRPRSAGDAVPFVIGACVVACITVAWVAPPETARLIRRVTFMGLTLTLLVGPILRGAGPPRVWWPCRVGAVSFLVANLGWLVPFTVGPMNFYDVFYAIGYACCLVWVVQLYRYVGGRRWHRTPVLDTVTVTLSLTLGLWIVALAPLANGSGLPTGLVAMMYPTADLVLLTMFVHLAYRLPVLTPSYVWLTGALGVQFVVDVAMAVDSVAFGGRHGAWFPPLWLVTFGALSIAATHPSVVHLARPVPVDHGERAAPRGPVFIVLTVSATIPAAAVPPSGTLDTVVRTVVVTGLVALLAVRSATTLRALSRAEAESRRRALHDSLTGLLNREALFGVLTQRLFQARLSTELRDGRDARSVAVLYLDCDDFKYVNDTWGHHVGDRLLREVATRLESRIGPGDVAARYGGDEFVIVTRVDAVDEARALAERVRAAFDEPVKILPTRLHVLTPSVGIALADPVEALTPEDVLRRADMAMYEAKAKGRGRIAVFDDHVGRRSFSRAAVGDRLGEAVRAEAFQVHFQPIRCGAGYGTLRGWEALARWDDPVLGPVPPMLFIDVAERHGYICDLGEFVLRKACHELARLHTAFGRTDLTVSVNVSAVQLAAENFADIVREARLDAGLRPEALCLEVTETALIDEGATATRNVERLVESGVRIAVDDFGAGYASLTRLLRLPVDCVKLDRSLIEQLDGDAGDTRTLEAVIELLDHLGVPDIVGEGVETPEQAAALEAIGCPMVQGYLYGRPAPVDEIIAAARPAGSPSRTEPVPRAPDDLTASAARQAEAVSLTTSLLVDTTDDADTGFPLGAGGQG